MVKLLEAFIHPPKAQHTASVIFLHGLGDSGHGWGDIISRIASNLPHVKWIFPHAPNQRVTLNMGMVMPAWYDILSLDKSDPKHDIDGIIKSVKRINELIQHEREQGAKKIVIGGFSQGAAVSLSVLLTSHQSLSGIIALSGYLPPVNHSPMDLSRNVPIFMAHGDVDEVVRFDWGLQSSDKLKALGYTVEFKSYRGLGHSSRDDQLKDVALFLNSVLKE
ncbi:hypothetical protein HMI56_003356 [Coelomomyces lativittatus]|nr:hypothetical protein HMI56_003356 [Coelomomyces lativittatus]